EIPGNVSEQIRRAWNLLFGKPPAESDVTSSLSYLDLQTKALTQYHHDIQHPKGAPKPNPPQEAMASLCQILFSSNRFLYIE
ncbi:MAG: hypothetical protein JWO08_1021, partial [Verrucomicrobiaceae bacterium]|nr:hypothetical protein [Verrucomicrobiaceae bacterium]